MDIRQSEPEPMETISHMGMPSKKRARKGKGRKIHNVIRRRLSNEGIITQKELTLKLKV